MAAETHDLHLPAPLREFRPDWGIVLGSGLAQFVDVVAVHAVVPFADIPGLPQPRVSGHAARFVLAELSGKRLLIAQGRVHYYEGHSAREVTAAIRLMAMAGVARLILTNAAGSLGRENVPGTWMMIKDHLNLTGTSPLRGAVQFVDMTDAYSLRLRSLFSRAASIAGVTLREGIYAGLPGPQYETAAEIEMLRILGANAVGMSTVLETIQARALDLEVAAFSCLTNWAAGQGRPLNHEEVLATGARTAPTFARILEAALRDVS